MQTHRLQVSPAVVQLHSNPRFGDVGYVGNPELPAVAVVVHGVVS